MSEDDEYPIDACPFCTASIAEHTKDQLSMCADAFGCSEMRNWKIIEENNVFHQRRLG